MAYIEDRRPIPKPSAARRKKWTVTLLVLSERLLDLRHSSKIEQIETALRATGKLLTI